VSGRHQFAAAQGLDRRQADVRRSDVLRVTQFVVGQFRYRANAGSVARRSNRLPCPSMTAKEALDAADDAAPGERLRGFETWCGPRGTCHYEPCEADAGRWTFCPDCLTVYDD